MKNKYKKLMNNSLIFAIGNLTSKFIMLLLVPLYANKLTTTEYGISDLIVTTATMLLPIISLSIYDAIFRYVMDGKYSNKQILSSGIMVSIISLLILVVVSVFSFNILSNIENYIYLTLLLLSMFFEQIVGQYARAINETKVFSFKGVLLSILICIFSVLFLVIFNLGIRGYLLGMIFAHFLSGIYVFIRLKLFNSIKIEYFNKSLLKNMIMYSLPLIPNSVLWLGINSSSKYFIGHYLGESYNGVFAVASKIPILITLITNVFMQAWQISAIEEYNSDNKNDFYSKIFNLLFSLLTIFNSIILIFISDIYNIAFPKEYLLGLKVVPLLLSGTIFSGIASFLGSNYIAAHDTKGVFKTSVYAAIISIILNFILIPRLGLFGAGISSMISFVCLAIVRFWDTRKFAKIELQKIILLANGIIILTQIMIFYLVNNINIIRISMIILLILSLLINRNIIDLLKILVNKILIRRKNEKSCN